MLRNRTFTVGFLAWIAGQAASLGGDLGSVIEKQPTLASPPATHPSRGGRIVPVIGRSTGLGFQRVAATGGYENAENTTVRVVNEGRIVQSRQVGEGGVAQISEVAPGFYSILATGRDGIAAQGIYLNHDSRRMSHRIGLVPNVDATLAVNLIRTHLQAGVDVASAPTLPASVDVWSDDTHFEIGADGLIRGQAIRPTPSGEGGTPLAGLYVAFIKGGEVIAETQTDSEGLFSVSGVPTGICSLAVSGASGFAAYSAEVIHSAPQAAVGVHRLQFVSHLAGATTNIIIPAAAGDFGIFAGTSGVTGRPAPAEPSPGGGGGGLGGGGSSGSGGGSGGGLGGGGGLLGALAGAGLGAGIGAALSQPKQNRPATPAKP